MRVVQWFRDHRHLVAGWTWVLLAIPGVTVWKESVLFVIVCSLWANIETSFGAHEAHRGRKEQQLVRDTDGDGQ